MYLFTCLFQRGHVNSYLMVSKPLLSLFILVFKLFQIWPVGALLASLSF